MHPVALDSRVLAAMTRELGAVGGNTSAAFFAIRKGHENADSIHIGAAEGQRFVNEDMFVIKGDDGDVWGVRYREFAYEHEGASWRQMRIFVPMGENWTMVVTAQATNDTAELVFAAARTIACSMAPLA